MKLTDTQKRQLIFKYSPDITFMERFLNLGDSFNLPITDSMIKRWELARFITIYNDPIFEDENSEAMISSNQYIKLHDDVIDLYDNLGPVFTYEDMQIMGKELNLPSDTITMCLMTWLTSGTTYFESFEHMDNVKKLEGKKMAKYIS